MTLDEDDFKRIGEIVRTVLMTAPASQAARPQTGVGGGATFPNYGRNKNEPVAGAEMAQLEYYREGCRKTLADPAKSRWHDKERALLAAIEEEMRRQGAPVSQPVPVTGGGANDGGPESDDVPF